MQPASRPDVDAIFGIPPTVAIEQRTSRGGRKSTVATQTELHHFLRLLFVKLGTQHCPDCRVPIEPQSEDAIAARLLREYKVKANVGKPQVSYREAITGSAQGHGAFEREVAGERHHIVGDPAKFSSAFKARMRPFASGLEDL